jgi:hypothetical protein
MESNTRRFDQMVVAKQNRPATIPVPLLLFALIRVIRGSKPT